MFAHECRRKLQLLYQARYQHIPLIDIYDPCVRDCNSQLLSPNKTNIAYSYMYTSQKSNNIMDLQVPRHETSKAD